MANFQLLQNTRKETFFLKSVFVGVRKPRLQSCSVREKEGVYVTIGNPAFYLFLYLTGVHFRGELQHGGDTSQQKIKGRPIRTREIGGVLLADVLYERVSFAKHHWCLG